MSVITHRGGEQENGWNGYGERQRMEGRSSGKRWEAVVEAVEEGKGDEGREKEHGGGGCSATAAITIRPIL